MTVTMRNRRAEENVEQEGSMTMKEEDLGWRLKVVRRSSGAKDFSGALFELD